MSMESKPRVSIGLPVYNGEKDLRESLDSLLSQEFNDFEFIISDNGSTDRTEHICREYAAQDQRIKYYRNPVNQGAIWNFNNVFQLASAEYFMWGAHDDYWHPRYLQSCVKVLDDSPSVVLVGSICDCMDNQMLVKVLTDPGLNTVGLDLQKRFKKSKKIVQDPQNKNALFNGLYRREILSKVMPLKRVLAVDYIILSGLSLWGEVFTIPEVLMKRRSGGDSSSLERVARCIPINNPWLVKYPNFVREFIIQGMVFNSNQMNFYNKIALSGWSLCDFLTYSFSNRTKAFRSKISPQPV